MLNLDRALRKGPITWLLTFTYENPINCTPIRDSRYNKHLLLHLRAAYSGVFHARMKKARDGARVRVGILLRLKTLTGCTQDLMKY